MTLGSKIVTESNFSLTHGRFILTHISTIVTESNFILTYGRFTLTGGKAKVSESNNFLIHGSFTLIGGRNSNTRKKSNTPKNNINNTGL